ncbi:hypothetical protein SCUCBS95973_007321 [Sporothrix curviconia]|uniref:Major facilitator superfamily (MFS) profile domain-containing protein n=1 Tax=Sporothrix curviconia TaxID=1260050 RepID=A0ABP0CD31_9PEZI
MVHTGALGAAVAGASNARMSSSAASAFRPRMVPQGSFHAGDIFPASLGGSSSNVNANRRSSVGRYHTFPTPADASASKPKKGPPPPPTPFSPHNELHDEGGSSPPPSHSPYSSSNSSPSRRRRRLATPLPVRQLGLLALLSLAEQTALNSIGPYLPTMVESFTEIPSSGMGLYVGVLASTFALAQLATNLFWGYLSDAIGRKPVMLLGSFLLMLCFAAFGFCTRYWHVVVVHVAMGLLNGNAAVVPTCLGEVTDRTNQSSAFTWLPVVYSLGSITGPALGGLLVRQPRNHGDDGVKPIFDTKYPFLVPNLGSAALLGVAVVVLAIWFDETLDSGGRRSLPAGLVWIDNAWKWLCCLGGQSPLSSLSSSASIDSDTAPGTPAEDAATLAGSGTSESSALLEGHSRDDDNSSSTASATAPKLKETTQAALFKQLLNPKTVLLLATYLVFQLANISFNSLYPIFSAAPKPTGRDLPPGMIGLLLSVAGAATIVFQVTLFQPLKRMLGNLGTYRGALFGIALSMLVMPWTTETKTAGGPFPFPSSIVGLHVQIGAVLVFKNMCAVGGLSSVMLLINNAAPSHETLGTLNGIAQTLSAAGRSVGPFLSGALFSLSTRIQRPLRGELLAWCLFGGVAGVGWILSLFLNGQGLESADWEGHDNGSGGGDGGDGGEEEGA